jgi:hypothetical protein
LEQLVKSLQFNLKLHKENERYKKENNWWTTLTFYLSMAKLC